MKLFLVVRVVTLSGHLMSKFNAMAVLFWVLPSGFIQAQTHLTLADCLRQAQSNHPEVQQATWQLTGGGINYRQAKDNFWPRLEGSTYHGINQGRTINPFDNTYINKQLSSANFSLQGSLVLFNGLRLKHQLNQARAEQDNAQANLQMTRERIALQTVLAYLQVLNLEDQLLMQEQQILVTRQTLQRQQNMGAEGATKPEVVSDLAGQLAGEEAQQATTQTNLIQAHLALAEMMNVPYDPRWTLERMPPAEPQTPFPLPQVVYDQVVDKFPGITAAEKALHSANFGVKIAQSLGAPAIGLNANLGTNYSSIATNSNNEQISYGEQIINNYGTSAGVFLSVPIFNNRQVRHQTQRAQAQVALAEQQLTTVRHQLLSMIQSAHQNLLQASNRYDKLTSQVAAYQESFRIAQVKLDHGAIHSIEYLTTKNNLDQARLEQLNTHYEYQLRMFVYDYFRELRWPG